MHKFPNMPSHKEGIQTDANQATSCAEGQAHITGEKSAPAFYAAPLQALDHPGGAWPQPG